ncbi:MAG: hypothetical protein BIFFINMI_02726 [Phycisphaerae bacterium]|nr:hypothetical protein [Phycisphaerae bacterium]
MARLAAARQARDRGELVRAAMPGGFDLPRQLMGEERACMAFYDQPELIADILSTARDTCLAVLDRVTAELAVDMLCVHEDFAGKSGPLVGPRQIERFIGPYYRAVWDLVSSRGTRLFDIDSDGDCNPVLDGLLAAGINHMHPFEPAAGMDIVAVRKRLGKELAIKGGIDKHVLRRSKADIRAELEYKMQPLTRQTGTIFGLDHRIPNGTPLENYRYYVKTGREILGIPPLNPAKSRGWARMA